MYVSTSTYPSYSDRYYYAMVSDPRGHLVETSIQLLSVVLDYNPPGDLMLRQRHLQQTQTHSHGRVAAGRGEAQKPEALDSVEMGMANLFCSFVSRLQMSEVLSLCLSLSLSVCVCACACTCVGGGGVGGVLRMCVFFVKV